MPPRDALPQAVADRYNAHLAHQARIRGSSIYPAIQNIILACRAFGLGTLITTNHIIYEDDVRAILNLPPEVFTFAMMPIGYPLGKFAPLARRPVAEAAFADRWGTPGREEHPRPGSAGKPAHRCPRHDDAPDMMMPMT